MVLCNKEVLKNVNKKIQKLKMLKKTQEVNHEIKKRKTEKRFDKQMKMIERDHLDETSKQQNMLQSVESHFEKERQKLKDIIYEQEQEHLTEKTSLVQGKESNLNFVSNENDELETRILRLKETIVDELEKIEEEHQQAVQQLVDTYEHSVKVAQEEVRNTIEKLKQNGNYYESMIKLQE